MTDKEMLEYAAKAIGLRVGREPNGLERGRYDLYWSLIHRELVWHDKTAGSEYPEPVFWNPLTDDGDALRLAIKCGISVLQFPACIGTGWPQNGLPARLIGFDPPYEDISSGQDVFAATRRAITRAAAEMGNIV